jgi:hypothetical protein
MGKSRFPFLTQKRLAGDWPQRNGTGKMKTNLTPSAGTASRESASAHSTKLMSLLALAGGAIALPQTGQADIIYTDLSGNPGVVTYNSTPFWFSVTGTAQVGFFGAVEVLTTTPGELTYQYRLVAAGDSQGVAGGVGGNGNLVQDLPFGATWDQPLGLFYNIQVAFAGEGGSASPTASYNNRYLAWFFEDSTQGNAPRYGWAEYNLTVSGYFAGGPVVTILRYGYDDSGAKPTMGQLPVPEPSSGALLALGAMALGSRGLRKWRQDRQLAQQA